MDLLKFVAAAIGSVALSSAACATASGQDALCQSVLDLLGGTETRAKVLVIDKELFECTDESAEVLRCGLRSVSMCTGDEPADPLTVRRQQEFLISRLPGCLQGWSREDFREREAVIGSYTRLTIGTRFLDAADPEASFVEVRTIAEIEVMNERMQCEKLTSDLRVRRP